MEAERRLGGGVGQPTVSPVLLARDGGTGLGHRPVSWVGKDGQTASPAPVGAHTALRP